MVEFMDWILELLIAEYGRRNIPGWVYLAAFIVSSVSSYSAWRIVERRRLLRERKEKELTRARFLQASLVSMEGREEVRYRGELELIGATYRVRIFRSEDRAEESAVSNHSNLKEVAKYLRANTKFVLSDFYETANQQMHTDQPPAGR